MLEDVYYINNNYYYNRPQQNQKFMVIETGTDERAPIILGRPFLNTSGDIFLQEQNYTNFKAIPT